MLLPFGTLMASGAKPYAPALANLGYLTWQNGQQGGRGIVLNRSVQADPLTDRFSRESIWLRSCVNAHER